MRNVARGLGLLVLPVCCCAQTAGEAQRTIPTPAPDSTSISGTTTTPPPNYPFTGKLRLRAYVKSWLSPVTFVECATGAGWGQLWDAPHEWGEGAKGYWTRFVSAYGQHMVNSTLLLTGTALLHEDNRYVPSGETAAGKRLKYALTSTLVTRHYDENGAVHRRLSFSRLMAFAGAAAVSRAWQPPSGRGVDHAAVSFGASVGVTAGFNLAREFLNFQ